MRKRKQRASVMQTFFTMMFWMAVLMVVVAIMTATEATGEHSDPCPGYEMVVSDYETCWGIDADRNYEAVKPFVDALLGDE